MRGKPFPKGHVPYNKLAVYTFTCATCGREFTRSQGYMNMIGGVPKTCSRICHNRRVASEIKESGRFLESGNPAWTGGIQTYRRHKKSECERCGTTKYLVVHHKNADRYDNRPENLETLCKRCHQIQHECWLAIGAPAPSSS